MRKIAFPLLLAAAVNLHAAVVFTDNFNSGASPLWGNEIGNWAASGGVYDAQNGSPGPNAHSLLPFALGDFSVDVNTTTTNGDGGVWLHAGNDGSGLGVHGVLLVIRPLGGDMYWHVVQAGSYGPSINVTGLSQAPHLFHLTVSGNSYAVFVDGSGVPATTLVDNTFAGGQTGLYDFHAEGFDNFSLDDPAVVPEPAVLWMLAPALALGALRLRRR